MKARLAAHVIKTGRDILLDRRYFWIVVTSFVTLVSALAWAFAPAKPRESAFFYQNVGSGGLRAEIRQVLPGKGFEDEVERVVAEYLLGPVSPGLRELFPEETSLRSLIYRKKILYIDLSKEAVLAGDEAGIGFLALERTVRSAFPGISSIRVTIDGQIPDGTRLARMNGRNARTDKKNRK